MSDIERYRLHTARKTHRCEECRQTIEPGTQYLYGFAILDGSPNWARFCGPCCTGEFHHDGSLGKTWAALQDIQIEKAVRASVKRNLRTHQRLAKF